MQFDFGRNWAEFSERALTSERVDQARHDFATLLQPTGGVEGKTFLDIGFGQGLSLLAAAEAGATAVGIDINPTCDEVLSRNRRFFPSINGVAIPVIIGSILDQGTLARTRKACSGGKGFDIVHSWGVLHHTGDMRKAIANAASLVKPDGHLVIAIYNRHWSSRSWLLIKYLYCNSPAVVQRFLISTLSPVIFAAKWFVTGQDPRVQSRGMDFHFNVVDWVGGYPYEYACEKEVVAFVELLGFRCIALSQSRVPTGCNEFAFRRA